VDTFAGAPVPHHVRRVIANPRPSSQRPLPELKALLGAMNLDCENGTYRFYHQSFKVYALQGHIIRATKIFRVVAVNMGLRLNPWFEEIVAEGTGVEFVA
jgi:hypothetical protein